MGGRGKRTPHQTPKALYCCARLSCSQCQERRYGPTEHFFWLALVTTVILGVAPTVDISWIFPQLRLKSLIHTDAGIVMSQSIPRTVHYKVYRSNAATATNMLQSSVMSKTTIKLQYNCNFG